MIRLSVIISLCISMTAFCALVFYIFPSVYAMIANADSLVLLDFARDLVTLTPVQYWNLPRAPYLFPDTVIALGMMVLGWHGNFTLLLIATVNLIILVIVMHWILSHAQGILAPPILTVALLVAVVLTLIGLIFPEAMSNLYWQLFASGAHFLTAVIVAWIFFLARPTPGKQLPISTLLLVCFLTLAEAISDSMALLLVMAWWPIQVFIRRKYIRHSYFDLVAIPLMLFAGTALSFLLPRQELVGSFFSLNQFINSIQFFISWLSSSAWNYGFIALLMFLTVAWPFLLRGTWPKSWGDLWVLITDPFFAPSMAIFFATPLFYQEVGSMRYLSFPALISLLSLCLMWRRAAQYLHDRPTKQQGIWLIAFLIGLALLVTMAFMYQKTPRTTEASSVDKMGLSSAALNAPKALECINKAKKIYPLKDGVASYWSARPIRFASQFEIYLAQIHPWRPRSGYFLWGNNGLDFVYQRENPNALRQYNFIIAPHQELEHGLWSAIATKASDALQCSENTVFYFANPDVLWNFLFPFGPPFHLLNDRQMPNPTPSASFITMDVPANELFTQVGKRDGQRLLAIGSPGFFVFGPYIPLSTGRYRVTAIGKLTGPDQNVGILDVIGESGKATYLKLPLTQKQEKDPILFQAEFDITKPVYDVEFRILIFNQVQGQFVRYHLEKLAK